MHFRQLYRHFVNMPFLSALLVASLFLECTKGLEYNFNFIKDHTYCKFKECCNADYIPGDINGEIGTKIKLKFIRPTHCDTTLVPALKAHFSGDVESKKALVISFHGTGGTGKNYVANFIAKSLYKKGLKSRFVHIYMSGSDFPIAAESEKYRTKLRDEVSAAITDCPRSLFIFDEVDKMPYGVLKSITSLVDYKSHIRGTDYNNAIFVFISNTPGVDISSHLGDLMQKGMLRENTKITHFEKMIELATYNLKGGMEKSSLIKDQLVDHYIPFLPLEKEHIYRCLEAEFKRWNMDPNPEIIENIIKHHVVFEKTGLFARSGCKRLDKQVVAVAIKSK